MNRRSFIYRQEVSKKINRQKEVAIEKSEYKNTTIGTMEVLTLKWGEPHESDHKIDTVLWYMCDPSNFRSWLGGANAKRWKTSVA